MKTITKIEVDPAKWAEMLERMKSGELDRPAAADFIGLKLPTLNTKLRTGGHLDELRAVRRSAGKYNANSETDPDKVRAMDEAVAEALASKQSVRAIWSSKYQGKLDYTYLCRKVASARALRTQT